jgi:hypothetical protein
MKGKIPLENQTLYFLLFFGSEFIFPGAVDVI